MKSKIVAIFALLIIALAVVGFTYAHWSETLYIEGTVNTGTLDAQFSVGKSWDTEPDEKDYSYIECRQEDHTLIVEIVNAYPSIDYYQEFNITNTGTIPIHVYTINIDRGTLPDGTILEITGMMESTQIDPEESALGTIHLHLDQDAQELETYRFSITIEVVQWNYAP